MFNLFQWHQCIPPFDFSGALWKKGRETLTASETSSPASFLCTLSMVLGWCVGSGLQPLTSSPEASSALPGRAHFSVNRDTFHPTFPHAVGLSCCPAGGQTDNARHGEQRLAFFSMQTHTDKFAFLLGTGSSSAGFVSMEITCGGFLCNPPLGMNYEPLLHWVAVGWGYCSPWQSGSHPAPFASKWLLQPPSQVWLLLFVNAMGGSQGEFAGFLLMQPLC